MGGSSKQGPCEKGRTSQMSTSGENWRLYLDAASRKDLIACYHLEKLRRLLHPVLRPNASGSPPIDVQAHFEGIVISVMAAVDQVAQAINSKLCLGARPDDLFEKAYGKLAPVIPQLQDWRERLIGRDLRRIRARIVHYSYGKLPLGAEGPPEGWKIEDAGVGYEGARRRELESYGEAAVRHADELIDLIPAIDAELRRCG
jgi:hypothetical protein